MKRMMTTMLLALAVVAMISTVAMAGDYDSAKKKAKHASTEMGKCCVKAAKAGEGCCGKDADAVKAAFADHKAYTAAMGDMHKCCATALTASKGCCGKEADELKAAFHEKVMYRKASAEVTEGMHKCCATALTADKGCCGKDAKSLKADYQEKVKKVEKKLASK